MVLSASPSSQISTHPQAPPHLHPRTELAVLLVSVIVPAIVAAAHVEHVPDAAHDLGVVRVVGLGWIGAGLVFGLARRLVATCAPESGRIGAAAAAIAAVTAGSTVAWQLEAAAPGGSGLGGVLALGAVG